jgi:NAD(P)-dependent dehydrogenase (short-subunit alcohol dehydrogenase family)
MSLFDLSEKTIVVTGAASGIGAETAKQLKAVGAKVIGLDRNKPEQHVDHYIEIDLSNPASIANAAAEIPSGIDGLCNIAGLPPTAGALPVMKVNVLGLQMLTMSLIEKMSDGGAIVNIASLAGLGWPDAVDQIKGFQTKATFENLAQVCEELGVDDERSYFFAKEVLIAWTMQNRWTWRERGIRMNCVSPGPVETPILKDFLETLGERAEEDMKVMDRAGLPTDIAPVAVFMCSDASAWIRGANIPCDGGMFAHVMTGMNGL